MLAIESITKIYQPPPGWLRPFVRTAARNPVAALREVSLQARRGDIIGLVGPNGAGKTTLIKIISTLLEPTSGRATIEGFDVTRQAHDVRQRIGLVLEGDQGLYDRLTGRQNLELYARLAGMGFADARDRATELLRMLDLEDRDKLVFGYSAGMKARLSIGRALSSDPPLLVLDEPTRSLDPIASRVTMRFFRQLAEQGRVILLSNHRLDEVVEACTRVVAVVDGRVCFTGSPDELDPSAAGASAALSDLLEREAALAP